MKVGIISDTHGWLDERVLRALEGVDMVVHAGDVMASRVLEQLHQVCARVYAVKGNNDTAGRWLCDDHERLLHLPDSLELDLPGGKLAVEHGHRLDFRAPSHKSLRDSHPGARVIVYGHTHRRVIDLEEKPWVVNPGAAGRVRTHGGPGCLLLHAGATHWHIEGREFQQAAA